MKRTFLTLIRREFWENKSLWIAPLAVVGLIICGAIFAQVQTGPGGGISVSPPTVTQASRAMSAVSLTSIVIFLGAVAGLAVFAYLLDCLFAERRDRSILFWKSLPVSDAETVLSKLVVAMVVVPLGVILLALLTQPIVALITWLRFESLRPYIDFGLFAAWPRTLAHTVAAWGFSLLWFAPVYIYLMLASVLARRAPLMYALLPPLVLILGEQLIFDSMRVFGFLLERIFPWRSSRLLNLLGPSDPSLGGRPAAAGVETHWWIPFQDINLWLGLAVAAGMLYIVIRLRQFRDDT
jgi:ABC-2 type transport system permease protein